MKVRPKPKGKVCCRCKKHRRQQGIRFCGWCANLIVREMRTTGYLQPIPGSKSIAADV